MECVQRLVCEHLTYLTVIGLRSRHSSNEGLRYSLVPLGNLGVFRNIHVPQTLEARAELITLSATQANMISSQASNPNISIVQDSLLAAYLMTKGVVKVRKSDFQNVSEAAELNGQTVYTQDNLQRIRRVLKRFGKKLQAFTGRGLISLILPADFNYENKNNVNPDEPTVKIYQGVIYEGTLNKKDIGSAQNSIIQLLHKDYGSTVAAEFVNNIQFITNKWLGITGFSVGLEDCMIDQSIDPVTGMSKTDQIRAEITKCYAKAKGVEQSTHDPEIREIRVNAALNEAKDIGLRIAKDALKATNNFNSTVNSGSKGDFFNIAQITGLLGQQNLLGSRVPFMINHNTRTLVHYPKNIEDMTEEMEFESRGFVRHPFIHGLNPQEFFFHAMTGREGVCDTAMGTAKSGYIQRRIVKTCEDVQVQYDGTIRDVSGRLYQFAYGDDNMDSTALTRSKNAGMTSCDVSRLVDRLNMTVEDA
jgi:DNA-directed RNA polymerase beta' subunit